MTTQPPSALAVECAERILSRKYLAPSKRIYDDPRLKDSTNCEIAAFEIQTAIDKATAELRNLCDEQERQIHSMSIAARQYAVKLSDLRDDAKKLLDALACYVCRNEIVRSVAGAAIDKWYAKHGDESE